MSSIIFKNELCVQQCQGECKNRRKKSSEYLLQDTTLENLQKQWTYDSTVVVQCWTKVLYLNDPKGVEWLLSQGCPIRWNQSQDSIINVISTMLDQGLLSFYHVDVIG